MTGDSHTLPPGGTGTTTGLGTGSRPPFAIRRESFAPGELAMALSHYETGVIESVFELPRGSADKPKVVLKTERGPLLLKRRGVSRDEKRHSFVHGVQAHLAARGFPLPRLVGTQRERAASVRIGERVYELYEFVRGGAYDGTAVAARAAGQALAELHVCVASHRARWAPSGGGYHGLSQLGAQIERLPERRQTLEPAQHALLSLREAYEDASHKAAEKGLGAWPRQVIHGDWHPGNLLFASGEVTAVVDFDSARMDVRVMDLASGALQFSLLRGGPDPSAWPAELDVERFASFCAGYDGVVGCRISVGEIEALPWLMIESLIVEAVAPVAATGSFARIEGGAFLRMIDRKVAWIREHGGDLASLVHSGAPTGLGRRTESGGAEASHGTNDKGR